MRLLDRLPPFAWRRKREELQRQRDQALAERDAYLRQRDEALGERNEILRQRDIAIGERTEILRQRDEQIGLKNLLSERAARYTHRADVAMRPAAATGDHLLLFLHLAKTGGMTLADILARNFATEESLQIDMVETNASALGIWSHRTIEQTLGRLQPSEAESLAPALLVYRALVAETAARRLVVCDASLRAGMLLDLADLGDRSSTEEFGRQVLASAESLGQRYRLDRDHGRHVASLAVRLFDELVDEHGLKERQRLLLQVAALLHDVGIYVSLRSHHKHTQYILAASQIFGLSDEETAIVANIARYHRGALPQKTHLPYVALDREDRITVDKLAAILRIANALDAEHVQKVRGLQLVRRDTTWTMQLDGTGDMTMERLAASARSDLFVATFGRQLVIAAAML